MTSEIQIEGGPLMTVLRRHRMANGLTLRVLAKRIGVTTSACSKWETGRSMPSARHIPKLARALDIDAMELTRLISPDPTPSAA